MDVAKLVICGVLALPAGYLVGLLVDRIPDALPMRGDWPGLRLTGTYLAAHVVTLFGFLVYAVRFDEEDFVGKSGWLVLVPMLVALVSMVALAIIDIKTLRLPDRLVLPTFLVSVVLITISSVLGADSRAVLWALMGAGMFFGILLVFHLIFGNRGLGFGDVKVAAVLGLLLGWISPNDPVRVLVLVVWTMLIAFVLSAVLGIALWITRGRSRGYPIGPFLVFGTFATLVMANPILFG